VDKTVIAVAQLAIAIGEPDANRKAAATAVAEAAAAGARLVVVPELCDSGYVFGDDAGRASAEAGALASPADDSATLRQWRALAAEHRLVIVGGFCERGAGGRLFNSAAVVDGSGTRAVYRKAHLWDKEKLVFTPGDEPPPVVDLGFGRVGVMICYDLEFPEWVRLPALAGADLVAAPVNWPAAAHPEGERPAEVIKAQAAAATNGVFVAVADRCQDERGVSWISGSLIVGPDGYPLAGPVLEDRPAVLTAACDLPRARDKALAGDNDLLADRRPALYAPALEHPATGERGSLRRHPPDDAGGLAHGPPAGRPARAHQAQLALLSRRMLQNSERSPKRATNIRTRPTTTMPRIDQFWSAGASSIDFTMIQPRNAAAASGSTPSDTRSQGRATMRRR